MKYGKPDKETQLMSVGEYCTMVQRNDKTLKEALLKLRQFEQTAQELELLPISSQDSWAKDHFMPLYPEEILALNKYHFQLEQRNVFLENAIRPDGRKGLLR